MSAAPGDKPTEPAASLPPLAPPPTAPQSPSATPQAAVPEGPPNDPRAKAFLAVSAVLLFGWLAWLSSAALTKSREPIVSRAQAAVAKMPVVAKVDADEKGAPVARVTVVEALKPNGPPKDTPLEVENFNLARGFTGPGEYL